MFQNVFPLGTISEGEVPLTMDGTVRSGFDGRSDSPSVEIKNVYSIPLKELLDFSDKKT